MTKRYVRFAWIIGILVTLAGSFTLGRHFALKIELPAHTARVERVSKAILFGGQAKTTSLHVSLYQNIRAGNFEYVESALCKLIKSEAELLSAFELPDEGAERLLAGVAEPHVADALARIRESGCAPN